MTRRSIQARLGPILCLAACCGEKKQRGKQNGGKAHFRHGEESIWWLDSAARADNVDG
jgi:hypothetical protein